jgi:hypothetical protein
VISQPTLHLLTTSSAVIPVTRHEAALVAGQNKERSFEIARACIFGFEFCEIPEDFFLPAGLKQAS